MKRHKRLKAAVSAEIGRLTRVRALLIATTFAADHDAEFDVADAVAGILALVDHTLASLDQLEAAR